MKKIIALILTCVMVLGLAACAPADTKDTTAGKDTEPSETTQGTVVTDPPKEAVTITVAAVSTAFTDNYPDMWKEIGAAFEAETGIKVELIENKQLEDIIGPSMQGGEFPDVIYLPVGRPGALTEQFIKGNLLTDLSDVLTMKVPGEEKLVNEKIAGGFTDSSTTNPYSDNKTYLAPMFYDPCGLFYNAGLFEEKGWEVPKTWDDMWKLGDLLAAENEGKDESEKIYLFTYPTAGYFDAFLYALMYSVGGPEFFEKATHYEEGIWDTPEGQKCFEIIGKLATYTNPVTPAQANDQDFKMNQQLVLDNKALFMPNGTWITGEMADAPRAEGFKWGMTALPAVESGGDGYSYCWFQQSWIPSGAAHVEEAKQFIAFLYSDKACELFLKGGAVQPVLGIADLIDDAEKKIFFSIYDNGAKSAMGAFAAYNPVAGLGTTREVFQDPMNKLVGGEITVEQWLADINEATAEMRANLK